MRLILSHGDNLVVSRNCFKWKTFHCGDIHMHIYLNNSMYTTVEMPEW